MCVSWHVSYLQLDYFWPSANSAAGIISSVQNERYAKRFIVATVGEEERRPAPESSLDNFSAFAHLNLSFPEASCDDARCMVSTLSS